MNSAGITKYIPQWPWFTASILLALAAAFLFNELRHPVYHANARMKINEYEITAMPGGGYRLQFNITHWFNLTAILKSYGMVEQALQQMDASLTYHHLESFAGFSRRTDAYREHPFILEADTLPPGTRIRIRITADGYVIEQIARNNSSGKRGVSRLEPVFLQGNGNTEIRESRFFRWGEQLEADGYPFVLKWLDDHDHSLYPGQRYEVEQKDLPALVRDYMSRIEIEGLGLGYAIVDIDFYCSHPQRAVDFLDTLGSLFFLLQQEELEQVAYRQIAFFKQQASLSLGALDKTMEELQRLREEKDFMYLNHTSRALYDALHNIEMEMEQEQLKRMYWLLLLDQMDESAWPDAENLNKFASGRDQRAVFGWSTDRIQDEILRQRLQALSRLYNEYGLMLESSTPGSPALARLEQQIRREQATIKAHIDNLKEASDLRVEQLLQRQTDIYRQAKLLPATERELLGIQREYMQSQKIYERLLTMQAAMQQAIGLTNAGNYLIEPVRLIARVSPKKQINYAIALVLALLVPVGVNALYDRLNLYIRNIREVEEETQIPVIGKLPKMPENPPVNGISPVVFLHGYAEMLEAFRRIRMQLQFFATDAHSKCILVTSTRSNEGKTFTALNLAGALSLAGQKTVYVNADLRKPSMVHSSDVYKHRGLSNYLSRQLSLENILARSQHHEDLYLITGGSKAPNPAELLENPHMLNLIDELSDFKYIIIDTPPVGLLSDAQPLIKKAHLMIYMICRGVSMKTDLNFIQEVYRKADEKNMVLVGNKM